MKKLTIMLALVMGLTILAGCAEQMSVDTQPTIPEMTTAPTEAPTQVTEQEPLTDMDPMGLVGQWQRTHTEMEGDKVPNNQATIVISGADAGSLVFTFTDKESSNFDANEKPLQIIAGELYAGCGNDVWYAETAGSNTYAVTMLDDNTLLLQLTFDFDGQPMVSTQWFARNL